MLISFLLCAEAAPSAVSDGLLSVLAYSPTAAASDAAKTRGARPLLGGGRVDAARRAWPNGTVRSVGRALLYRDAVPLCSNMVVARWHEAADRVAAGNKERGNGEG